MVIHLDVVHELVLGIEMNSCPSSSQHMNDNTKYLWRNLGLHLHFEVKPCYRNIKYSLSTKLTTISRKSRQRNARYGEINVLLITGSQGNFKICCSICIILQHQLRWFSSDDQEQWLRRYRAYCNVRPLVSWGTRRNPPAGSPTEFRFAHLHNSSPGCQRYCSRLCPTVSCEGNV